jgi:hypothetical protein
MSNGRRMDGSSSERADPIPDVVVAEEVPVVHPVDHDPGRRVTSAAPANGFIHSSSAWPVEIMSAHEARRLQAIMFTDMVGYTALGQRNEVLSLALVEEQLKELRAKA